jgi:polyvinyl alcohol dehydrogenase (cytochrome)
MRKIHLGSAFFVAAGLLACSTPDTQPVWKDTVYGPHDWGWYGRDFENTRANLAETQLSAANVAKLEMLWSVDSTGATSTPLVYDNTVYFTDWTGRLYAHDFETGKRHYEVRVSDKPIDATPFVTEDRIYLGDGATLIEPGDGAILYAVDRRTGKTIWETVVDPHEKAHIYGSPVVVDGIVLIGVASFELMMRPEKYIFRGSMVALDWEDGKELWRVYMTENDETSGPGVSIWSTVAIDKKRSLLFVGTGNTYAEPASPYGDGIIAINYKTGQVEWFYQITPGDIYSSKYPFGPDADVGASPNLYSIGDRDVVGVGDKSGHYTVVDRSTGKKVWQTKLIAGSHLGGVMTTAAYTADAIFVTCNDWTEGEKSSVDTPEDSGATAVAYALAPATGTIIWETPIEYAVFGALTYANGLVFFGDIAGNQYALNAASGVILWSHKPGGQIGGGSAVSNGRLLVSHGFKFLFAGGDSMLGGSGLAVYGIK